MIPHSCLPLLLFHLTASQFTYLFADLRRVVETHDRKVRNGKPKEKKLFGFIPVGEEPLVNFNRPELIWTQGGAQPVNQYRYLKYPVTAAAIAEFVQSNLEYLRKPDGDIIFDQEDSTEKKEGMARFLHSLDIMECFDADIIEFDDQFSSTELVYGIVLNRYVARDTCDVLYRRARQPRSLTLPCSLSFLQNGKAHYHCLSW